MTNKTLWICLPENTEFYYW